MRDSPRAAAYRIALFGLVFTTALPAAAHAVGSSESETVLDGGAVTLRLHLPHADARLLLGGDTNGDGVLAASELAASPRAVARFLDEGVDLRVDDAPCPAAETSGRADADGVELMAHFQCGEGALGLTFFFLGQLGAEHRHVAVLRGGSGVKQVVLTSDQRHVAFETEKTRGRGGFAPLAAAGLGAMTVALVVRAWLRKRARAARRP